MQIHNELHKERGSFLASKSMKTQNLVINGRFCLHIQIWNESTNDQRYDNSKILQVHQVLQYINQKLAIITLHALAFFIYKSQANKENTSK